MILYTIDSITVNKDDFKKRITDMGYLSMPQENRTWVHISGDRQIIMAKVLNDSDGKPHTFRITIDT